MISLAPDQRSKQRRSHQKSRNGCFECKRRRVKCDEVKPSCTRCSLSLDKCIYPLGMELIRRRQKDILHMRNGSSSASPDDSLYEGRSPSFEASVSMLDSCSDENYYPTALSMLDGLAGKNLYEHFVQHTSYTLTCCKDDQKALRSDMPKLAAQSELVMHSLLAISAACICHDTITTGHAQDINEVQKMLMTGYQHFNFASQLIREMISSLHTVRPAELMASAVLLVPFATSSQQINHWISSKESSRTRSTKRLSTTPRDVIIIMRAVRATLQILPPETSFALSEQFQDMKVIYDSPIEGLIIPPQALAPSRTHVMFPILANTISCAFTMLQLRIESIFPKLGSSPTALTSAFNTAFEILKIISGKALSTADTRPNPLLAVHLDKQYEPESVPLPHVAPWLRSYARKARNPLPTEPLTSLLLNFLVTVPQQYLDFILPLLDQRLEGPRPALNDSLTELTCEQALALDIYAHWSVLMFLVEEDSWWIGNLPVVTLRGMVNRYGHDFVPRALPEITPRSEEWWPGSMLGIFQTIRRYC